MSKIGRGIIAVIGSISLLVLLILLSIQLIGVNKSVYHTLQKQFSVADEVGITQDELDEVTDVFIDYTKDARDDLSVLVTVDGEQTEMFNERENLHMVDVKGLYLASKTIVLWLTALCIFAFAFLVFSGSKKTLYATHRSVSAGFLAFCAALSIYFLIDFNGFWTNVHLLLFTNDLWMLNPLTDRMILMFPLNFFLALSVVVLLAFVVVYLALWKFSVNRLNKIKERQE